MPGRELPTAHEAVVLAGGSARRLGGVDKPALTVGGTTLPDRVLAAVAPARSIVVGPRRLTAREVIWARESPAGSGPVAALAAALPHVEAAQVLVLAADLTFLDAGLVADLVAAAADRDGALLVDDTGRDQLLAGCWRTAALRRALPAQADGARMAGVLIHLDAVRVTANDRRVPPWWDCDTPQDLAAARDLA